MSAIVLKSCQTPFPLRTSRCRLAGGHHQQPGQQQARCGLHQDVLLMQLQSAGKAAVQSAGELMHAAAPN